PRKASSKDAFTRCWEWAFPANRKCSGCGLKRPKAPAWLKVFNDLKARGILDILILCGDGLTGLTEAVVSVFPATDVQLCVVHQVRNATKFVSYKDRKSFCASMRH